jgi:hypothetical protein
MKSAEVRTTPARPARLTIDRIREAARTGLYWTLNPEPDDTWTLRQLDDTTGRLGEPVHTSPAFGADQARAIRWAADLVGVPDWTGIADTGRHIEAIYAVVRELAYTTRPGRAIVVRLESDPRIPEVELVVVAERWTATGLTSDPLYVGDRSGLGNTEQALRAVSEWYGLDPAAWDTVVEGREYQHR